ncbi:MAG: nucleotidyltransferase domain-containing protein [Defluviitaleaceae bacterium]|nr:nucleotidyltransferase domain-containing protein [Defluviitaleaceae bacterium]
MDKTYTLNEIKDKLFPVFRSFPVERAVVFGSFAKGKQLLSSDVDIIIYSEGKIKGIDFYGVLETITETLRIPVDLFEASQIVEGSRAEREIHETGVIIYERA